MLVSYIVVMEFSTLAEVKNVMLIVMDVTKQLALLMTVGNVQETFAMNFAETDTMIQQTMKNVTMANLVAQLTVAQQIACLSLVGNVLLSLNVT